MIPIIVILLALAGLSWALSVRPKAAPAGGSANPTGSAKKSVSVIFDNSSWMVGPLILWVVFWSILFFLYPSAWSLMWNNQPLFWIGQVIYVGLVVKGKNHVDLRGKPARPAYVGILGFTVMCLFFVAIWKEAAKTYAPTPRNTVVQASAPKQNPASAPVESPKRSTLPAITKTFLVQPNEVSIATIPAGYHVSRTNGTEKLILRQTELANKASEWELETKGDTSVQVTLWCEPDTQ